MNVILKAENIFKLYKEDANDITVLSGLELEINESEIVVIFGPSGSGKTTLIHILGGLDTPNQGRVLLDGVDLFAHSDAELSRIRNRDIGFVFQFHQLLPEFTVVENVLLPAMIGVKDMDEVTSPLSELYERCMELLRVVGLHGKERRLPRHLSGGERQRVGVARALINNPKIVFADEPSGSLDADTSRALQNLFLHLNREMGVTFVIATHKEMMSEIATRVFELQDGKLQSKSYL